MPVCLITMPFDSGLADVGMGRGPGAILARGVVDALADAQVLDVHPPDPERPEIARTFAANRALAELVGAARGGGRFPLVLTGNCNACLGAVAGLGRERLGVVWLDAHADFDTPEDNLSGFFDVMALSTLTGRCWAAQRERIPGFRTVAEQDVILVGARDLEPYQREALERSRIRRDLAELDGLPDEVYVHVDLDVLDPSQGRANEYAAPGGLTLDELLAAVERIAADKMIAGAALSAYDPSCDPDGRIADAAIRVACALTGRGSG